MLAGRFDEGPGEFRRPAERFKGGLCKLAGRFEEDPGDTSMLAGRPEVWLVTAMLDKLGKLCDWDTEIFGDRFGD